MDPIDTENNMNDGSVDLSQFSKHHRLWVQREEKKGYSHKDMIPSLEYFINNQSKFDEKDIFKWDAKDLENKIKEGVLSKRDQRVLNRGQYKILRESKEFILVRIDDQKAARFWGVDTKWCITMEGTNHFDYYRDSNDVFYICVDKNGQKASQFCRVCIVAHRDKTNNVTGLDFIDAQDVVVEKNMLPKTILSFLEKEE